MKSHFMQSLRSELKRDHQAFLIVISQRNINFLTYKGLKAMWSNELEGNEGSYLAVKQRSL